MDHELKVIHSVGIIIILILLAAFLKKIRILREEHGDIFAKLITQYTIPALIFSALSTTQFDPDMLWLALVMILTQFICAILALVLSKILRLNRTQTGAFILGATFSSSGFLGYAVIEEIYQNNTEALSDAAVVSELGVATMIFTFGVLIASHFGSNRNDTIHQLKNALRFFYSPIFISLVAGVFFSFSGIKLDSIAGDLFNKTLYTIASANTLLVTLTIGVMLNFKDLKKVWLVVALAIAIKLIVQPLIAYLFATQLKFQPLWLEVIVLEAAMPTAALTAVFARKYGCDAELSSALVITSFISSILTILLVIFFLS